MGYGDDLMITAFAAEQKKKNPNKQIVIGSVKDNSANHSIIYENNPNITNLNKIDKNKEILIINYNEGNRPYINYKHSYPGKYIWNEKFRPTPGELYFNADEIKKSDLIFYQAKKFWNKKNPNKKYKGIIFVETSSTKTANIQLGYKHLNKEWGFENWKKLINKIKNNFLLIHSVHENTKSIEGIFSPQNINFRLACAILKNCNIYLGPEGGFSHVAAALRKKAVVYFGGWISPKIIGYEFHENIYYENPSSPCGITKNICTHCNEARDSITVEFVESKIKKIFNIL